MSGISDSAASEVSSDEDENAELVNPHVYNKFIKVLAKIKTHDQDIYQQNKKYFSGSYNLYIDIYIFLI